MADIVQTDKAQSMAEIRQWDVDFTNDLHTGVTVESATAEHIPPSGEATTPTVGVIVGNVVPVLLGPLSVTGIHTLVVVATYSDTEISEIRLQIPVNF
jgi:hypothetical protein